MVRNQTINVHCGGCKGGCGNCKKKRRRANKRGGANSHTKATVAQPNFQPIHAFSPVYIQSGNPPPEPNPLLKAVQDLKERVDTHHDYYRNELRHRVHNVDRGFAVPVREQDTQTNSDNHMETQTHRMDIHRDSQTSPDTIEHISNPLKSTYATASQMFDKYPARKRQPFQSPAPTRDLTDELRTPSARKEKGVDFEDIYPVRNSSNVIADNQAGGGGTGVTRGTRQDPVCSACGLRGHKKNSKKCPQHAFHEP
jgi:hypothetical protein